MNWRLIIIAGSTLLLYYVFSFFGKRAWITFLSKEQSVLTRATKVAGDFTQRIETISSVLNKTVKTVIILIGAAMILSEIGINIGPILAGAGIVGVALGFGAQSLVKDILGGVFVITEHQYVKGDVVKLGDVIGTVTHLSLRTAVLRDSDGVEHFVPHGSVTQVANYTKQWVKINLMVPFSCNNSVEQVQQVLTDVVKQFSITPLTVLGIERFEDNKMIFHIDGEVRAAEQWRVLRELRWRIKLACEQNKLILA
ncbi:MAG: mechanosensitive ion channel family protein [Patescibacteria group bacterium]|jgi:small conductance mechanosensitive channel